MTESQSRYRAALEEILRLAAVGPPAPPHRGDSPADRDQNRWYNDLVRVAAIADKALRGAGPPLVPLEYQSIRRATEDAWTAGWNAAKRRWGIVDDE